MFDNQSKYYSSCSAQNCLNQSGFLKQLETFERERGSSIRCWLESCWRLCFVLRNNTISILGAYVVKYSCLNTKSSLPEDIC